jgi:hypothetical protein
MKFPSVADPDPESGAFIAHGSGIREGKKSVPWIRLIIIIWVKDA